MPAELTIVETMTELTLTETTAELTLATYEVILESATTPGPAGAPGVGVPVGGTTGQVLGKTSGVDYATAWVDQTGGGSGDAQTPWLSDIDADTNSLTNVAGIGFDVDGTTLPSLVPLNEGGFDGSPGIELDGTAAGDAEFSVRVGEVYSSDYALMDVAVHSDPGTSTAVTWSKVTAGQESTIGLDIGGGGAQFLIVADAATARNLRIGAGSGPAGGPDYVWSTGDAPEGLHIKTSGTINGPPSAVGLSLQVDPAEKVGFHGATPVAQQTSPTTLNELVAVLENLGLTA